MEEQARAFKDDQHDGLSLDHASKFYLFAATKGDTTWMVGLVLRSDHEPSLIKLRNLIGADGLELVPLEAAEALAGTKSGFIGPVELDVPMYADRSLDGAYNLTCGANQTGYHHFGFKPDRDLGSFKGFFDLRMAQDKDRCPRCATGHYQAFRGIEVGQVFKLGTKYSTRMGCTYLDADSQERPMVMGCYGIGITRTVAAVIEQNYDADGIIWPWPVAPYHVQIVCLDPGNAGILAVAAGLEQELESAGIEVLLDEREGLSPGVRFKDADLLGFPLRVVVGARGLKEGLVELRDRRSKETVKVPPSDLKAAVLQARDRLLRELDEAGGR
jgi:prolyl-tRNA synthetase